MSIKHIHDNAYKYIFSNKRIFYQLLKSFVKENFVKEIEYRNIDIIDKSFVSDEFLKRESDIIYRIQLKQKDIYIYFLLEFQSTVDKTIPVRMLLYILQFYVLLLRNSKKGKLPSVFPILLYNGQSDWTIPDNLKELIDIQIPGKYIPDFHYYKIIEKNIPDNTLLKIHNLASAIIYLEKRKDEQGLKNAIDKVIKLIEKEKILDLRMFTIWFNKMFRQKVEIEDINKITNITEVKSMLTLVADDIMKQGIEQGIEQGKEQGKREDQLEIAKKMLNDGVPVKKISQYTGLNENEIKNLKT